ncbi:MAG: hypothetical protein K0R65_1319 [Crocinitomicaceae bacterium]|jgi:hypothetical protein|nr:hypothetical protein [Crocinitomicaceae bacterium]
MLKKRGKCNLILWVCYTSIQWALPPVSSRCEIYERSDDTNEINSFEK